MQRRNLLKNGALGGAALLVGCVEPERRPPYIDYILVQKSARLMTTYHEGTPLKTYNIRLGFAPDGHKERVNDGKTPEGQYYVDRKNPYSAFHLSLGINYPNREDRANAARNGWNPGGDIFIHGAPNTPEEDARGWDWTWGCIAVTDVEITEIYSGAGIGTVVDIRP